MKRFAITTALALSVAACASMSEKECSVADWRAIGFEDGVSGATPAAFSTHRKACAAHGIAANFGDYKTGHDEGIAQFCRPQNGYSQGTHGKPYQGVCPSHLESAFVTAHLEGFTLYQKFSEMHRIGKELDDARERAKTIEHDIVETTAALAAPGIPAVERANLALELKHLTEEKIDVERSIPELERAYEQAESDYAAFKNRGSQQYSALR